MEEERHYPPGAEPETPAEAPAPEGDKAPEGEQPKPEGEAADPKADDEQNPDDKKPDDKPEDPPADPKINKPRSIYDDLKDERGKRKTAEQRAKELEEENARLRGDIPPDKPADEPAPKPDKPADDLDAFAEEQGVAPEVITRLAEILAKRIPTSQLSEEDKQALANVRTWQAEQAQAKEDAEVMATAPTVKAELGITDDAELANVMKEIVRLAHTPEFHDKEAEYIVWKNKAALSKLVSPKKPSFEQGGQPGDAQPGAEPDFSTGKVTPAQVQQHMDHPKSSYEIRKAQ